MFGIPHAVKGVEERLGYIRGVHHRRIGTAHDELPRSADAPDLLRGQKIPPGEVVAGGGLPSAGAGQAWGFDGVFAQLFTDRLHRLVIVGLQVDPCFTVGNHGFTQTAVSLGDLVGVLHHKMEPAATSAAHRNGFVHIRDLHEVTELVAEELHSPGEASAVFVGSAY